MRLTRLKLRNIRSYLDQELNFPEGSVLLSGNVGSGKSTVLLAVDFALFGLQRGSLSGNALLRNGKDEGSVELGFEIGGKSVIVKRCLKRTARTVAQDAGWLSVDNKKSEGTAQELKQKILDLLNYPANLLTKNKSLIFRYTVYTPQEEMKQILTGDKEVRLETLRRVFGIDKYKRILENAKIAISQIKEGKKALGGEVSDLEDKQAEKEAKEKELAKLSGQLEKLKPAAEQINHQVTEKKLAVKNFEKGIKELQELNKKLEVLNIELKHRLKESKYTNEQLAKLNIQINVLEKIKVGDGEKEKQKLDQLEEEKKGLDTALRRCESKIQELKTKREHAEMTIKKIGSLNTCPTCFQEVCNDHKTRINNAEEKKIQDFDAELKVLEKNTEKISAKISKEEEEINAVRASLSSIEIAKAKLESLTEKKERKGELTAKLQTLKKEIGAVNSEKDALFNKIAEFKDIESLHAKAEEELESSLLSQRRVEVEKAGVEASIKAVRDAFELLRKEINRKLELKAELAKMQGIQNWLEEQFLNLMSSMERNVMAKIHSDFNGLFSKWFGMLIDNDALGIRLDSEFTPIIEQDGYEMEYDFLSGGERTAAALAYRLALNQTINNLMSTIRTNEIIILDEPTDGFSSEQLDKMKLVLEELDVKQVIIVSHESKVETFVDNVLRFNKNEHISQVV